jgi:hypothetical protein
MKSQSPNEIHPTDMFTQIYGTRSTNPICSVIIFQEIRAFGLVVSPGATSIRARTAARARAVRVFGFKQQKKVLR